MIVRDDISGSLSSSGLTKVSSSFTSFSRDISLSETYYFFRHYLACVVLKTTWQHILLLKQGHPGSKLLLISYCLHYAIDMCLHSSYYKCHVLSPLGSSLLIWILVIQTYILLCSNVTCAIYSCDLFSSRTTSRYRITQILPWEIQQTWNCQVYMLNSMNDFGEGSFPCRYAGPQIREVFLDQGYKNFSWWHPLRNADNLPVSYRRKQRKWESEEVFFIQRRFLPVASKPWNPRPHSKRLSSLLLTCSSKRWLKLLQNTLMAFVWVRYTPYLI